MRVVGLNAENFKRLEAVEIVPDGDVVVIAGANAQGKSSVLDAIWAALAGKSGQVDRPIRDGAEQATVRLDLGDLVVEKTWVDGKTPRLTVTSAEGARFTSPQKMLDTLLGRFSFDPLAFAQAKPSEQRDTLLDLSGLRERLAEIDGRRRAAYEERTNVNRELKRAEAALAQTPKPPPGTPDEAPNMTHLVGRLHAAQEHAALLVEYEQLQTRLAQVMQRGQELSAFLGGDTVAVVQQQIDQAGALIEAVHAKQVRAVLEDELTQTRATSTELTVAIEQWDAAKDEAISEAALPVPGLGFDDDGVTLNGVPFSQSSAAERLRTSVAVAMAANPHIRVIRITDGSLLDSKNMALISEMAREKDFQVWVERVDESGQVGIVIEEGRVAP